MKTVTGIAGFKGVVIWLLRYILDNSQLIIMNNRAAEMNCHLTKCQKLSKLL
jgi:hypothetical protein